MYKILIVGHGEFPKGINDAVNLIVGKHDHVFSLSVGEEGHEKFEKDIEDFLKKNDKTIVFADLTGGAPHQVAVRKIFELEKETQFAVSGSPLAFLLQLVLMTPKEDEDIAKVKEILNDTLKESLNQAKVMSK